MTNDLREEKRQLRTAMKKRRAASHADIPDAGNRLRDQFIKHISLAPDAVVASYLPVGSEIDPRPLAETLRQMGHVIALPIVIGDRQALTFHRYTPGDVLKISDMGIPEPLPTAEVVVPDVLLVPMLAFDLHLYRLGYGGGFYDRSINDLSQQKNLLTIGLAFSSQELPEVPRGRYDVKLDKIATEIQTFG